MSRSWLKDVVFGVCEILVDGEVVPFRSAINFVGADVEEDPSKKWITVTIPAFAALDSATPNATPDTLALRDGTGAANFAGTCNFEQIVASDNISCVDFSASGNVGGQTVQASTSVSAPSLVAATSVTSPAATVTAITCTTLACATATCSSAVSSPAHTSAGNGLWRSSNKTAAATNSGSAAYGSGDVTGSASSSGAVALASGASTGNSGAVAVTTGASSGGDSGHVLLVPGAAPAGSVGSISLGTATPDVGDGERIVYLAPAVLAPLTTPASGTRVWSEDGALTAAGNQAAIVRLTPTTASAPAPALLFDQITAGGGTTDDTPLELLRYAIRAGQIGILTVDVIASDVDHVTAFTRRWIQSIREGGGTVSTIGGETAVHDEADAGASTWLADATVDGTDYVVTVTGEAARNITWVVVLTYVARRVP